MVSRWDVLGFAALAAALCGCPNDLGKNLHRPAPSPVATPTNLVAAANGGFEVRLSWKDNAEGEGGYRLEMSRGPFGSSPIVDFRILPENSSSAAYAADQNSTYYFRVFAITDALQSDPSNEAVVTTPKVFVPPTGVSAVCESSTEAVVSWDDVPLETGFRVDVSHDGGSTWSSATSTGPGVLSARILGLTVDTEYVFRVTTLFANGVSDPSGPAGIVTLTKSISIEVTTAPGNDAGAGVSIGRMPSGLRPWLFCHHTGPVELLAETVQSFLAGGAIVWGSTAMDTLLPPNYNTYPNAGRDGSSMAIDRSAQIHVLAHDLGADTLRYYVNPSTIWTASVIDPGPGGANPRMELSPVDDSLHAIYPAPPNFLKYIYKGAGQAWSSPVVLSNETDASNVHALGVDAAGTLHAVWVDARKDLVYGSKPSSGAWVFQTIPLSQGLASPDSLSIALDSSNTPHLALHDPQSRGLHHLSRIRGDWETESIDQTAAADVGRACTLAIDRSNGRLHVAYYDATHGDLRYARKDVGGAWVRRLLDAAGDVGTDIALMLGDAGAPAIAYRDATNRVLKFARGSP